MKKVIIICFLSFAMCLSLPNGKDATNQKEAPVQSNASGDPAKVQAEKAQAATPQETPSHNETAAQITPSPTPNTTEPKTNETVLVPPAKEATTENKTEPAGDKKEMTDDKQKPTENKSGPKKDEQVTPATEKTESTAATVPVSTTMKPDSKEEKKTTPTMPTMPTTVAVTTPSPTLQSRAFDGPSFIGGIILTMGLLAIGFIGFKYYKNPAKNLYTTF